MAKRRSRPKGGRVPIRASITLRNGKKIYARDYGKRGFPLRNR
jgi:DsbC/DsbD-like thiol-disulfide interchange protein